MSRNSVREIEFKSLLDKTPYEVYLEKRVARLERDLAYFRESYRIQMPNYEKDSEDIPEISLNIKEFRSIASATLYKRFDTMQDEIVLKAIGLDEHGVAAEFQYAVATQRLQHVHRNVALSACTELFKRVMIELARTFEKGDTDNDWKRP